MTIEEREGLRSRLRSLGFDEVRFAAADRTPDSGFREWLEAGCHADMDWLARGAERRVDVSEVLPGVKSLIVFGVVYLPEGRAAKQGRWGKYALGRDYHETIGVALKDAGRVLEQCFGVARHDCRAWVDTGPVLERGWAAKAGLGWQGKNAMLISREHGNWLLLAALLTRLEIPADPPLPALAAPSTRTIGHHCGSCTRCLNACPTDAFPRPGWVDARRCIAYHTIENRGSIPRELRSRFGGRVFGCDTCLDVCPWNRFARAGRSALLNARADIADLTLVDLLRMEEGGFAAVFRHTPIKRSRLAGLLRNACVAAGNWHDVPDWHFGGVDEPAVVASLVTLCRHTSDLVRAHAVWAMHRLVGVTEARRRLAEARALERAPLVMEEYASWSE